MAHKYRCSRASGGDAAVVAIAAAPAAVAS